MRRFVLPFALVILIPVYAACTPLKAGMNPPSKTLQTATQSAPVSNAAPTLTNDPAVPAALSPNTADGNEMTLTDQQGAIVVEVTPLNLDTPADTLEFDIAMNTHSVDLSMDLAPLSVLSTDMGGTVRAAKWDAPLGGHHVEGRLIFPAINDGKPILEGAVKLTLTITNVDAPSRIFEWELK